MTLPPRVSQLTSFRFFLNCFMVIAVCLCSAGELEAKKGGKKKKPATNVITSINKETTEFVVNRKTYIASDRVVIKIDNKKAEFSDLKVGMTTIVASRVANYGKKVGTNTYEALRISAMTSKKKKN